jgi:hypothetical protein
MKRASTVKVFGAGQLLLGDFLFLLLKLVELLFLFVSITMFCPRHPALESVAIEHSSCPMLRASWFSRRKYNKFSECGSVKGSW